MLLGGILRGCSLLEKTLVFTSQPHEVLAEPENRGVQIWDSLVFDHQQKICFLRMPPSKCKLASSKSSLQATWNRVVVLATPHSV